MTQSWSDVRGRLERLAAAPKADKVFGVSGHKWVLRPPLTADQVAELEAQLHVELPGEYRTFLLEAGAGGAGPFYGLFPVHEVGGSWQWAKEGAELNGLDLLRKPFLHPAGFDPPEDKRGHVDGLIYLSHLGCGTWEGLVVSGPERGRMWADHSASDFGLSPLDDGGAPMGFARWYRRWLNSAEKRVFG